MLFDPIQLSRGLGPVGTILRPCENNIRSIPVADGFYRREIPPVKTVLLKTFGNTLSYHGHVVLKRKLASRATSLVFIAPQQLEHVQHRIQVFPQK